MHCNKKNIRRYRSDASAHGYALGKSSEMMQVLWNEINVRKIRARQNQLMMSMINICLCHSLNRIQTEQSSVWAKGQPVNVYFCYATFCDGLCTLQCQMYSVSSNSLFFFSVLFLPRVSAGGHHSHGQAGVAEVSDTKVEADVALGASGKHEHSHEQLHACIGVSLVLGFVFMLLVDQIGSSHVHNTEGQCYKGQQMPRLKQRPMYKILFSWITPKPSTHSHSITNPVLPDMPTHST